MQWREVFDKWGFTRQSWKRDSPGKGRSPRRSSEWDRTRPCGEQGLRQEGQEVQQQEMVLKGKLGLGAWALDCQAGRLTKENFVMG